MARISLAAMNALYKMTSILAYDSGGGGYHVNGTKAQETASRLVMSTSERARKTKFHFENLVFW